MKKAICILICLCLMLSAGCGGLFLAWHHTASLLDAAKEKNDALAQVYIDSRQRIAELETREQYLLENDPISSSLGQFPYSGAFSGYLYFLEWNAYKAEMEHAAQLLKNHLEAFPEYQDALDAYLLFVDKQAQAASDKQLSVAKNAGTSGAYSHLDAIKIPIYRSAVYNLIIEYLRFGDAYEYIFSIDDTRQTLLDSGWSESYIDIYLK